MLIILEDEIEVTDIQFVDEGDEIDIQPEMVDVVIAEDDEMLETLLVDIEEGVEIVCGEMVEMDEALETEVQINDDVLEVMVETQCIEMVELEVVDDSETVNEVRVELEVVLQVDNID